MTIKRSRGILAIGSALALGIGLVGCGSPGESADGPVTISFWNGFTSSDRPAVEEIVARFNESQDDVTVEMTIQPWDVFYQKLLPAYSAGEGPTIAGFNALQFPGYASKGVLADLTDFYAEWDEAENLSAPAVEATMYDGVNYGVPMSAASTMLYYNKALLEAAGITELPTTLDELAEQAVQLTQYNASNPTESVYGFAIPDHAAVSTWTVLMQANGGGVVSDDGTETLIGSDESISTIEKWADLVRDEHISPVGLGGVEGDTLFSAGKAAYYVNGPWASAGFIDAGVDFGVIPVPEGSVRQTATLDSNNFGINAAATDAERAGAEEFVKFWASVEQQTYWALQTGFAPTRTDVETSALEGNPNSLAFFEAKNSQLAFPGQVNYAQMDNDVLTPTIQRILNGEGTVRDLFTEAAAQIDALL